MLKKFLMIAVTLLPAVTYSHGYRDTAYETIERPRQECWTETSAHRSRDYTGTIIGGIAGGILGHQVGKGSGRAVATAIGATTGAIVGDQLSGSPSRLARRNVQRCRTVVEHVQVPVSRPRQNVVYAERNHFASYPENDYRFEEDRRSYHRDRGMHRGWHKRHHPDHETYYHDE